MREFYCTNCKFYFAAAKYWENPVFLADMVTVCPDCGGKCWENKPKLKEEQEVPYWLRLAGYPWFEKP